MTDPDVLPVPAAADESVAPLPEAVAPPGARTAVARGRVLLGADAFLRVQEGRMGQGDVLGMAQVAGILGAKQASRLVPLCQDAPLSAIDLDLSLNGVDWAVEIRAFVKTGAPTGVEVEALTAVSVAALTVYDLCKSVSRDITITDVQLLAKTGGQSGDYRRTD
jgi:cyclic pyranopterin monophosphate synthase